MKGELEDYINKRLMELLVERYKREGWWCPRCQMFAAPLIQGHNEPGWCIFCGMDPLVEGPAPRRDGTLSGVIVA